MTTPPPADHPPIQPKQPKQLSARPKTHRPARPGPARHSSIREAADPGIRSDAELIAAARRGDNVAFDLLITRHRDAAARLALRLVGPTAADALVADAVGTVTAALRGGGGPVVCFRPYLLMTVRRRNYARAAEAGRIRPMDDLAPGRAVAIAGSSVNPAILPTAAAVFRRLPEDTKVALWHTEVDADGLAQTGVLLGMTGTEVAELAFSAREAFRQAHLGPYLSTDLPRECRWAAERLGSFAREALAQRDSDRVGDHLDDCPACRVVFPGVEAVENQLRVLLAMLVLGAAAGPYLGRESAPAARARLALAGGAAGRVRALVGSHSRSAAVLGLGVVLAAGGFATAVTMAGDDGGQSRAGENKVVSAPNTGALSGEEDEWDLFDEGPDSGTASLGSDAVLRPKRTVVKNRVTEVASVNTAATKAEPTPARSIPVRTVASTPALPAVPETPAVQPDRLIAEDGTLHADLGVVKVDTSNEDGLIPGLLGGISILPPNSAAQTD